MSQSLFSRYSSLLLLHLWLLGNKLLPARISSAFTAIPLPTIKGYLDNQSANSSRRCLLVGAMKDYMSSWLAVHLTPQGNGPMGTRKSGGAISMAKEGSCMMQWRRGCKAWGGCVCVCVHQCWHSMSLSSSILFKVSKFQWKWFSRCDLIATSISLFPDTFCL